jgi:hypothetical protein
LPLISLTKCRENPTTPKKKKEKKKKTENKTTLYAKILGKNSETPTKSSNYFLNAKKPGLRRRRSSEV